MRDFAADEATCAGKHLEGDLWVPPPLQPALPVESEEARLAVEWAASGMPSAGSRK